jgi:hypothetical protein
MPCSLDCSDQLTLVFCTRARNPFGDDLTLFRNEPLQLLFILVIDIDFFVIAESTRPPAFYILLRLLLTSSLMLYSHGYDTLLLNVTLLKIIYVY